MKCVIRTYNIQYILDTAQIREQLVSLNPRHSISVKKQMIRIGGQQNAYNKSSIPNSSMMSTTIPQIR